MRSLLDTADVAALRQVATGGASAAVAAALVDSGVLQFDVDDPAWDDRDRVVVAGPGVSASLQARLTAAGAAVDRTLWSAASGGEALALAFGAAASSRLDGGVWRSWCVLDGDECDDGRVWEVARAGAEAALPELSVIVAGGAAQRLWAACGWHVHTAPSDDPLWLLGAMDQALVKPVSVVVVTDD